MSALIRQSHANDGDPLWASSQGNENIVTNQITINQGGSIRLGSSINSGTELIFNKALDGSTSTILQESYRGGGGGPTNLELTIFDQNATHDVLGVGDISVYGKGSADGTANYVNFQGTGGSFGLSYGNNNTRTVYLDKLETGTAVLTTNTVGPVPVSITAGVTYALNPIPNAPSPFNYFGFGVTYPTTAGSEYDVYAMGSFGLVSGAGDPTIPDTMVGTFFVGTGATGTGTFYFNPTNSFWTMRARLIPTANNTNIRVGFQNSLGGTSTAVWSASCSLCDIVRVK